MLKSENKNSESIFDVEISADKLTVLVAIKDFSPPPAELARRLKEVLARQRVKFGFQLENIKRLIQERNPNLKLPVAKGKSPFPGRESRWEFVVNFKKNYPPAIDENKPLNLREDGLVGFVRKGETIAHYHPGEPSHPGTDVFGKPIPIKPFTPRKVKIGQNIQFDATQRGAMATSDGFIRMDNEGTIYLEPVVLLEQADPRVGELTTNQTVVVLKDVRFGARIISQKDVWVQGVVEDAYIKAGGNIVVLGGVMGTGKGKLIAGNNIYMFSGRYQKFYAEKDIYFEEELVGCEVSARRKILSHFGRMVGGKAVATRRIYIKSVGSSEGIQTVLEVGVDETLAQRIQKANEILNGYLDKVVSIKQEIYDLVLKQLDAGLTPEEEQHLKLLQHQNEIIPQKLEEIRQQIQNLEQEKKELVKADIVIPGDLFDGVVISVREEQYEVKKNMRLRRFYNVGGKIRMEVFKRN